jgi:hypothetical protein
MMKPNLGRALSVAGAIVIVASLALVWYHIDRLPSQGDTSSTGWDQFPRLRAILVAGALLTVASAVLVQRRWVVLARGVLGLVLAALVARRIIDPPDLSAPVSAQPGVYVGLAGAIAVALGGLVDTGREAVTAGFGLGGGRFTRALPPGGDGSRVEPHSDDIDEPGGGTAVRVPNHAIRGR